MGAALLPFLIFTCFWGFIGIVLPILVPKGQNKGYVLYNYLKYNYVLTYGCLPFIYRIIQVVLMLTAVTCWAL